MDFLDQLRAEAYTLVERAELVQDLLQMKNAANIPFNDVQNGLESIKQSVQSLEQLIEPMQQVRKNTTHEGPSTFS